MLGDVLIELGVSHWFGRDQTAVVEQRIFSANFELTAGEARACLMAARAQVLEVAPCAGIEAGVLSARGASSGISQSDPWAQVQAGFLAQLSLGRLMALSFSGALGTPLGSRASFRVWSDRMEIYRVPALSGRLGLALTFR
jgi:hypothetical protein